MEIRDVTLPQEDAPEPTRLSSTSDGWDEMVPDEPDLFLNSAGAMSFRDINSLMEFPFFSISKNPAHEVRSYDDGQVRIEIKPGHRGLATIWDKDILIFVSTHLNNLINQNLPVSRKVSFYAHDFLVKCQRSTGGRSYEDLAAALDRLQSTSIRTNIKMRDGTTQRSFFSWIKAGRVTERTLPSGRVVMGKVEVEIEDWIFKQIAEDRSVLQIDMEYFNLTSGVARRVYELGRKHCGRSASFAMNLSKFASKIGYGDDDRRNFKRFMMRIAETNDLPEYLIHFALLGDAGETPVDLRTVRGIGSLKIVFTRRQKNVPDRRALPTKAPVSAPPAPESEEIDDAAPVSAAQMEELRTRMARGIGTRT